MAENLLVEPRERLLAWKENAKVRLIRRYQPRAGYGLRAKERPNGTTLSVKSGLLPPTPFKVTLGDGIFWLRPGLCRGVEVTLPGGQVVALTGGPVEVAFQRKRLVGLRVKFVAGQVEAIEVGQIASLDELLPHEAWRTLAIIKGTPSAPNDFARVIQVVHHNQEFVATGDLKAWKNVRFFWWAS